MTARGHFYNSAHKYSVVRRYTTVEQCIIQKYFKSGLEKATCWTAAAILQVAAPSAAVDRMNSCIWKMADRLQEGHNLLYSPISGMHSMLWLKWGRHVEAEEKFRWAIVEPAWATV